MNTVANKNLKWGVYRSPQCDEGVTFEQYIIENQEDLNAFAKEFPEIEMFGVYESMQDSISRGQVVIANDRHPLTGFPTWRLQSDPTSTHPSAHIRVS